VAAAAAAGDDGAFEYLSRWMNADERARRSPRAVLAQICFLSRCQMCASGWKKREWENERGNHPLVSRPCGARRRIWAHRKSQHGISCVCARRYSLAWRICTSFVSRIIHRRCLTSPGADQPQDALIPKVNYTPRVDKATNSVQNGFKLKNLKRKIQIEPLTSD
jgi:hypothetical protein